DDSGAAAQEAPAATTGAASEPATPAPAEAPASPAQTADKPEQTSSEQAVKVPDIGDFAEVDVIEVLVAEGDEISEEQSLITVESDKASMEIPSPVSGTVKALKVKTGDKVTQGSDILI